MKKESPKEILSYVENYCFNENRYKEFREHYENYRQQLGVMDTLRHTLQDMRLEYLLEKF